MTELPITLQIMKLRSEIGHIANTIHSLRRSGLDSAIAQKLIVQKRAELECMIGSRHKAESTPSP